MNKLCLLIFLLLPATALSQLKGTYWHHNEWNSETIIFKRFHRFEYQYYGESRTKIGKGKYKLRGDSLTLNFGTTQLPDTPNIAIIHTGPGGPACSLQVRVIEERDQSTLPYATVDVYRKGILNISTKCNDQGICHLTVPSDNAAPVELVITYSDLDTEQLSLVASGKYDITVKMRERKEKYYQKGDQLVFHFIKRRTRKMLYLSHTRGTSLDYATRYKKVGR